MNKFFDGKFDLSLVKEFLANQANMPARIFIFNQDLHVDTVVDQAIESNIALSKLSLKENSDLKSAFDLILIGGDFFLTVSKDKLSFNTGENSAIAELRMTVKLIENHFQNALV